MYASHLEERTIPFDAIYLDPNNPRFWHDRARRNVPDPKVTDARIQQRTQDAIDRFGVQELYTSILRNGFLPMDRIVVRPIQGHSGSYVVVEGNRRTRALQKLRQRIADQTIDEDGIDADYLSTLTASTDIIEVLVYNGSETKDISWILQGIRHISGIKDWEPAQQARLIADRVDNHKLTFTQVGQQFGIGVQKVARLYRGFKALNQMFDDEEFRARADNRFFSLFEEATRNKDVKQWLGWDDSAKAFTNTDNLHRFYDWISPAEEFPENSEKGRRIHDPRHVKKLGTLVSAGADSLLNKIDNWEIGIEKAAERASAMPDQYNPAGSIEEAIGIIRSIPQGAIARDVQAYLAELAKLSEEIERSRKMASALLVTQI